MPKEVRTRSVDKSAYRNYLKKADEFLKTMNDSYEKGRWNACVANAVHCTISCCDAITAFYLGFRHAGDRHLDAVELLGRIDIDKKELESKVRHFTSLISVKNIAEYEERLLNKQETSTAKKSCERFYGWVNEKVKR